MIRRCTGYARVCPLVLAALLAGGRARAETAVEVEGQVRDGKGRPVPGADVVVTDPAGRLRRAAVSDSDGRFVLRVPDGGPRRIAFYTERGARVTAVMLPLAAGTRVWLDAADGGAATRVTVLEADDRLPGGPAGRGRGRDLRTALVALPGVAAPGVPADGPVLLGADPAEAQLRVDGFLLNDPIDGRAPWELPTILFAAASPTFGLDETGARGSGLARVELSSRRAERATEGGLSVAGALAAPAGEAQGAERPTGWSQGGSAELTAGAVRAGGRLRGHLATAPGWLPFESDPESVTAMRGRRARNVPWLARADAEADGWELGLLGLGSHDRWSYGRAGRIVPPRDPTARARDLVPDRDQRAPSGGAGPG